MNASIFWRTQRLCCWRDEMARHLSHSPSDSGNEHFPQCSCHHVEEHPAPAPSPAFHLASAVTVAAALKIPRREGGRSCAGSNGLSGSVSAHGLEDWGIGRGQQRPAARRIISIGAASRFAALAQARGPWGVDTPPATRHHHRHHHRPCFFLRAPQRRFHRCVLIETNHVHSPRAHRARPDPAGGAHPP